MIVSFVLCLPLNFIENSFWRKFYSSTCGFAISFYFHGTGMLFYVVYILTTYLWMKFLPRRAACIAMAIWSCSILMLMQMYYYLEVKSGFLLTTILRMNFAKIVMVTVNYSDAGKLKRYPMKRNVFTAREKYYATPFGKKLDFWQWINYFLYVGAQPVGPMHEYYEFDQFINFKGNITKKSKTDNF